MKINYDKVRNFNQLLLSIAGIIGVIILLIIGLELLPNTIRYNSGNDNTPSGIPIGEETNKSLADSLEKKNSFI